MILRALGIVFLEIFLESYAFGQFTKSKILNPVKWEKPSANKSTAYIGETIEIIFTALIDEGWYMYSSEGLDESVMAIPTTFTFEPSESYELIGKITPVQPKKKFDPTWNGNIMYFEKKAVFKQKIKIKSENLQLKATAEYQVCNEESCLPPTTVELVFSDIAILSANEKIKPLANNPIKSSQSPLPALENSSMSSPAQDSSSQDTQKANNLLEESSTFQDTITQNAQNLKANLPVSQPSSNNNLAGFMLYAFLFGIAAIFTPCVFPMIPITISYFTEQQKKWHAIVYGLSIVLIYTLFGALVAPLFGPAFGNWLSTHWLPNLIFFVIFVAFGLSFLGMFEITLPSWIVNKADAESEKGGIIGVFFMAFTLVLVSFSCTGPIVGTIMVQSAGGDFLQPIAGMFAFGTAFGLPFGILAFFPSLLQKLPKAGGWLNSVKVTLGFIELALSFKFLSMIDQVYHLGILDRHINIAIWIAIAFCMGLYYLGKFRLHHESAVESISVLRLLLAMICFTFVAYLIPGMFGAPLESLSGLLPPSSTHNFDIRNIIRNQIRLQQTSYHEKTPSLSARRYADKFKMPHNIKGYFDFREAQAVAIAQNKPLLIDFTGHGCVNCRKMEDIVWADTRVQEILNHKLVLVSLYVDDRTEIPENEWIVSKFSGKTLKTIGSINAEFQMQRFGTNAQPYYVLLSPKGELLAEPIGYEPDVEKFLSFLSKALKES
ncbi:MAG: protein-disulfide reductase DsbD family protein [Cytophagales bacterium]|nr:protein-disulfide reductase DsbD family protein [Cytophagales bacterium]MDW8384011.1 protein-disulfide reductase DsbD family protein [Flammeovirgaceae bacterium]